SRDPPHFTIYHFFSQPIPPHPTLHSFPTRRSSDLHVIRSPCRSRRSPGPRASFRSARDRHRRLQTYSSSGARRRACGFEKLPLRSEEHTSELQSHLNLVCRLLLEKKK